MTETPPIELLETDFLDEEEGEEGDGNVKMEFKVVAPR